MKHRKTIFKSVGASLLIAVFASQIVHAEGQRKTTTRHTLTASFSAGELDVDRTKQDLSDDESKHFSLSYDHHFNVGLYLGIGYLDGESGELSVIDDLFDSDELVYDAGFVKAGYQYVLTSKQAMFAEVSVLDYETRFLNKTQPTVSDQGTGVGVAVGWQYQLDNGVGFKVSVEQLQLGSDVDIESINGGLFYRF